MESSRNIASHSSIISKEQSKETCTSQNGNIKAIKNVPMKAICLRQALAKKQSTGIALYNIVNFY